MADGRQDPREQPLTVDTLGIREIGYGRRDDITTDGNGKTIKGDTVLKEKPSPTTEHEVPLTRDETGQVYEKGAAKQGKPKEYITVNSLADLE